MGRGFDPWPFGGAIDTWLSKAVVRLIEVVDRGLPPDGLAEHLVHVTFGGLTADACTIHVWAATPMGELLHLIGQSGLTDAEQALCTSVEPTFPLPVTRIASRVNPTVLLGGEIRTNFTVHCPIVATEGALICLPLHAAGATIGAAIVRVGEPPAMTAAFRTFLGGVTAALNLYVRTSPDCRTTVSSGDRRLMRGLTARERRILELIQLGHSNASIAQQLSFSPSLIKLDLKRVMNALGASDRYAAVARARQLGLLNDSQPAPRP